MSDTKKEMLRALLSAWDFEVFLLFFTHIEIPVNGGIMTWMAPIFILWDGPINSETYNLYRRALQMEGGSLLEWPIDPDELIV